MLLKRPVLLTWNSLYLIREAVSARIAWIEQQRANAHLTEDERADYGNDAAALDALIHYLDEQAKEWQKDS